MLTILDSIEGGLGPAFSVPEVGSLSRLKRPRPYPVEFSRVVFCLAGRMGESGMTGCKTGESRFLRMWDR